MKITKSSFFLILFFAIACTGKSGTKQVADNIYEGIEFDMPKVVEPTFFDYSVSITDFGAVGDGQTLNSGAFSKAIETVAEKGGGSVIIPCGLWLTGPIVLKSNINIHAETGAMVIFSTNKDFYPLIESGYEGQHSVRCLSPIKLFGENPKTKGETDHPDYLKIVKNYADAMISNGRDIYGTENTPLFASALNRKTMKLGSENEFGTIEGVRKNDRSIGGANPLTDTEFYEILYSLSEITGNEIYAREADKSLQYFFTHCQSPITGLMAWGEHLYWDFEKEACGYGKEKEDYHECGVWPFWDKCYEFAPDACWKFTIGEWDHQIADKKAGYFSRHARWSVHEPYSGFEFPRYAGQMIERWADAYQRKENINRKQREELLTAITVVFSRMQANTELTKSGYLPAGSSLSGDHVNVVWLTSNLELARCLEKAAPLFDNELAGQMKKFALKQDLDFLNAPHRLDSVGGGFAVTLDAGTGIPRIRSMNKPFTSTWGSGYGYGPHSQTANLCYSRYQKLKPEYPGLALNYKKLMLIAAEQYLLSSPDTSQLLKPDVFADVIGLMLNSFELTGDLRFYKRANYFGQLGIKLFLNNESPLPKATNQHNHYETITGGPAFMNKLLKIHMTLN